MDVPRIVLHVLGMVLLDIVFNCLSPLTMHVMCVLNSDPPPQMIEHILYFIDCPKYFF